MQERSAVMRWFGGVTVAAMLSFATGACAPDIPKGDGSQFMVARFDPVTQVIPIPNDLVVGADGLLALPVPEDADAVTQTLFAALNSLDGWSTTPTMSANIVRCPAMQPGECFQDGDHPAGDGVLGLDPSTFASGIVLLDTVAQTLSPVTAQWNPATGDLFITPDEPLVPDRRYAVALTRGILDTAGNPLTEDTIFALVRSRLPLVDSNGVATVPIPVTDAEVEAFKADPANSLVVSRLADSEVVTTIANGTASALDNLRRSYAQVFAGFEVAFGSPREDIKLMWTFETQSMQAPLEAMAAEVRDNVHLIPPALNVDIDGDGVVLIPKAAHPGTMQLPISDNISSVVEGSFDTVHFIPNWAAGETPSERSPIINPFRRPPQPWTLPFTMILPDRAALTPPLDQAPFRVAVVGHPLTSDRYAALGVANTLAGAGYAVISFELFDHGNRTVARDADGGPDAARAGTQFVSLDIPGSRDGLRQSALDMVRLVDIVRETDWEPLIGENLDTTGLAFVGCGLGAGIGVIAASVEPAIEAAVINTPPADWGRSLLDSMTLGPAITALAASVGFDPATDPAGFAQLVDSAAWILGPADPVNYGTQLQGLPMSVQTAASDPVFPAAQQELLARRLLNTADLAADAAYLGQDTATHCYLMSPDDPAATQAAQTAMAGLLIGLRTPPGGGE